MDKETRKEYMKKYKEEKRDKIKEYMKKYYETHDPLEKINCPCGSITARARISTHRNSNKHLKYELNEIVNNLNNDELINLKHYLTN